jgi:hypothetical protein
MQDLPRSSTLLRRVALRLRLASIGRRAFWTFAVLCAAYALLLLVSRFTGAVPLQEIVYLYILAALPVAAGLIALAWHRRPSIVDAARRVDQHRGTKDLYLTVALLETSAGEYQPLVMRDAEARAGTFRPADVVPFDWARRAGHAAVAAGLLVAGLLWLPQFDPFGTVAAADQVEAQKEELAKSRKATKQKLAELRKEEDREGENSEEVAKAIEGLKLDLRKMQPTQQQQNFKVLAERQRQMSNKWQNVSAEKLKELLKQASSDQQFGAASQEKLAKWSRELQEGSTESLEKEIEEIKEDLQQLLQTKDPVKKAELQQKLKKRMSDLHDFASENVNSKPLAAALERAMKQLETSKQEGLATESLEAASDSMELGKLELQEIAQSAKDLQALEEALNVIKMARKANEKEGLDGAKCEGCSTLADYAEMYAQLAEMYGYGEGQLGGRGQGEGGVAPEDESVESGFKMERSNSPIVKGKVLLSLQTKGLSDSGDAIKAYREALTDVKQGVSEAIEQEQVPPGYHEGIKSYFDSIKAPDTP